MTYNVIQEFDEHFYLVAHPFPQIQGELLLFQHKEYSEDDKVLVYKDYSLLKRNKLPTLKPK
jgi:hypothetical protein